MPVIELYKKATGREISDALMSAAQTSGFSCATVNGYKSFECQCPDNIPKHEPQPVIPRLIIQIIGIEEQRKYERLEWLVYLTNDTSTTKIDPAANQKCKLYYERLVSAFRSKLS